MKQKATLKQIAKELNVSVSTVSKALSNSPEISEPTKVRVKEFARLKNYKPNNIAVNLKSKRSKTIGVILPNILNPFFAKVFSGIEKAANEQGYNVITCISNESLQKEIHAMEMLSNGTIDGFILSIAEETQKVKDFKHLKQAIADDIPIVMFDRISEEVNCDKVIVDDFDSAVDATNHLVKLNCQRIAMVSTINNLSVGKLRAEGYRQALKDNNHEIDESVIIETDSIDEFDAKLPKLFSNKIDGIFSLDEHASVSVHKMAIKQGITIPGELNIIGFADGVWSKRLTPSLSTVSQHAPEIGEAAAKMLIKRLETKADDEAPAYETKIIKTELRQRESTKRI